MPQCHRPAPLPQKKIRQVKWRDFSFPDDLKQRILKQRGKHLKNQRDLEKASREFGRSLEVRADAEASAELADCFMGLVQPSDAERALKGKACLGIFWVVSLRKKNFLDAKLKNHKGNLFECDALFDQNEFEKNLVCIQNKRRNVRGHRQIDYIKQLNIVRNGFPIETDEWSPKDVRIKSLKCP